jgi:hypothetical protein
MENRKSASRWERLCDEQLEVSDEVGGKEGGGDVESDSGRPCTGRLVAESLEMDRWTDGLMSF